jgi:hypothetical protein
MKIGAQIMDSATCRERAEVCRKSALETDDGDQSAWWLHIADLWDELACTKEPSDAFATLH